MVDVTWVACAWGVSVSLREVGVLPGQFFDFAAIGAERSVSLITSELGVAVDGRQFLIGVIALAGGACSVAARAG